MWSAAGGVDPDDSFSRIPYEKVTFQFRASMTSPTYAMRSTFLRYSEPYLGLTRVWPACFRASTSCITFRCGPFQLSRVYVSYCPGYMLEPPNLENTLVICGCWPIHVPLGSLNQPRLPLC